MYWKQHFPHGTSPSSCRLVTLDRLIELTREVITYGEANLPLEHLDLTMLDCGATQGPFSVEISKLLDWQTQRTRSVSRSAFDIPALPREETLSRLR